MCNPQPKVASHGHKVITLIRCYFDDVKVEMRNIVKTIFQHFRI